MQEHTCPTCGITFTGTGGRKFCSQKCMRKAHRDSLKKTCSVADCANPVRAKGWCSKHYSKLTGKGYPAHLICNSLRGDRVA